MAMTIREKGYHRWDGQLQPSRFRWFPIFLNGIKSVIAKKHAKGLFLFTIAPFFMFLLVIYLSSNPKTQFLQPLIKRFLTNEAIFFRDFAANGFLTFMLIMLGIFFGAELISGDFKFNSFPLYFSRPLDRKDYMWGKFSIILFYFLLFTLVPGVLLHVFKFLFSGRFNTDARVLLGQVITPILISFFIASLVLMVSSLSSNTRYVRIIIFVVYLLSDILGNSLPRAFHNPYLYMISIKENIKQMGSFLFNTKPWYQYPGWMSLVLVLVLSAGAFFIIYKRIGKAEAQIETGN